MNNDGPYKVTGTQSIVEVENTIKECYEATYGQRPKHIERGGPDIISAKEHDDRVRIGMQSGDIFVDFESASAAIRSKVTSKLEGGADRRDRSKRSHSDSHGHRNSHSHDHDTRAGQHRKHSHNTSDDQTGARKHPMLADAEQTGANVATPSQDREPLEVGMDATRDRTSVELEERYDGAEMSIDGSVEAEIDVYDDGSITVEYSDGTTQHYDTFFGVMFHAEEGGLPEAIFSFIDEDAILDGQDISRIGAEAESEASEMGQ